jgi:hypothetical protein
MNVTFHIGWYSEEAGAGWAFAVWCGMGLILKGKRWTATSQNIMLICGLRPIASLGSGMSFSESLSGAVEFKSRQQPVADSMF